MTGTCSRKVVALALAFAVVLAVFAFETSAANITTTATEIVDDWNALQVGAAQ